MSHTPEPWRVNPNVVDGGLPSVLAVHPITKKGSFYVAQCNTDPDATHIVACVNGCAGLNPAAYREVIELLRELLPSLEHERVHHGDGYDCQGWRAETVDACTCRVRRLQLALAHAQETP